MGLGGNIVCQSHLDSAQNRLLVMLQNKSKDLDHLPVTARVLEKMAL